MYVKVPPGRWCTCPVHSCANLRKGLRLPENEIRAPVQMALGGRDRRSEHGLAALRFSRLREPLKRLRLPGNENPGHLCKRPNRPRPKERRWFGSTESFTSRALGPGTSQPDGPVLRAFWDRVNPPSPSLFRVANRGHRGGWAIARARRSKASSDSKSACSPSACVTGPLRWSIVMKLRTSSSSN